MHSDERRIFFTEDQKKIVSAGILLVRKRDRRLYLIEENGKFGDLGGKSSAQDASPFDNALREFKEETGGLECNFSESEFVKIYIQEGYYLLFCKYVDDFPETEKCKWNRLIKFISQPHLRLKNYDTLQKISSIIKCGEQGFTR